MITPESALRALAATAPAEAPRPAPAANYRGDGRSLDAAAWLTHYAIEVKSIDDYQGGKRYILRECPFNPEHTGTSVAVFQDSDGKLGFKCQHASCADKTWADLRELKEPGYRERRQARGSEKRKTESMPQPTGFHLTDAGNAEYFTSLYGDRLRYDHRRDRWLEWATHYWREDTDGHVMRLALKADRDRYKEALSIEDLKERERVAKWAIGSEQRARLEAAVAIARNLLPIADSGEHWDDDPWLFCVANGVIDLRTGGLRPGKQSDLVTMKSPAAYDPEASAPRWQAFLAEVFDDNADLIAYLQKYFGYALTGVTREQLCLIGYGQGANGKGRLSAALRHIQGDYAYNAPFSTFELTNRAAIPNDMAALVGKRLVTSSETNEGTRLNEARLKALVGEDPITARFLHCEFFTFIPTCKLFLTVNHRPRVHDDTYGFWRKVRLVPFNRQFKGRADDKDLLDKMISEASGILSWLIEGCLKWQREGLEPTPECVTRATAEYQSDSDPLSEFILDQCAITPQGRVSGRDFYQHYKDWCKGQVMKESEILTNTAFGRKMAQKFKKSHGRDGAVYTGVGMKCDGFVTGFEATDTENNVIENLEISCGEKVENSSQPVNPSQGEEPQKDADRLFLVYLSMTRQEFIDLWTAKHEAHPLTLVQGQTIIDLDKFLRTTDLSEEQWAALSRWCEERSVDGH